MKIVHISDLHFWRISLNPLRLAGKRMLGMGNLILNRARRYRMENISPLRERMKELQPDHILITGDLTTTSLEEEFEAVRLALRPLDDGRSSITVIPGNHDRYTRPAERQRLFERYFGEFAPSPAYPWIKYIPENTVILGLDVSRPTLVSARGTITVPQIEAARRLLEESKSRIARLIVACHYPIALPDGVRADRGHDLRGKKNLQSFLAQLGPHLYCHGHIHTGWTFIPAALPQTLCLNPGAALKRRRRSGVDASLLEILLTGNDVEVRLHMLIRGTWEVERRSLLPGFFAGKSG